MKPWLIWVGISFIFGGGISLALNLGVEGQLSPAEDLTGYSLGWMLIGSFFIIYSLIKKTKEKNT